MLNAKNILHFLPIPVTAASRYFQDVTSMYHNHPVIYSSPLGPCPSPVNSARQNVCKISHSQSEHAARGVNTNGTLEISQHFSVDPR